MFFQTQLFSIKFIKENSQKRSTLKCTVKARIYNIWMPSVHYYPKFDNSEVININFRVGKIGEINQMKCCFLFIIALLGLMRK